MRQLRAGAVLQLALARRTPDTLLVLLTAPVLALVFVAVAVHTGRPQFAATGVVTPTLMSLWMIVLLTAGQAITDERNQGTLEGLVAAPVQLSLLLLGRLLVVATLGAATFLESWLVVALVFDQWLVVHHPVVLLSGLAATALAAAGTASILSSLFVLMPSARILQNTLTYPFYLLSGLVVPVSAFPGWLQPPARLTFLSWSADLLRDSMAAGPVRSAPGRIAVVLLLGALAAAAGSVLLRGVLGRVRRTGTLART